VVESVIHDTQDCSRSENAMCLWVLATGWREPKDDSLSWGAHGKERGAFRTLAKALSRMDEQDRKLLLSMAQGMARRGAKR
jgi:hypothetical protein